MSLQLFCGVDFMCEMLVFLSIFFTWFMTRGRVCYLSAPRIPCSVDGSDVSMVRSSL